MRLFTVVVVVVFVVVVVLDVVAHLDILFASVVRFSFLLVQRHQSWLNPIIAFHSNFFSFLFHFFSPLNFLFHFLFFSYLFYFLFYIVISFRDFGGDYRRRDSASKHSP